MPESYWVDRTVADCLEASFAGEWGSEPNPANALVLRATDIDDAGHVVGAGAARSIPMSKLRAKQLQDGDVLLEGSGGGPGKPVGRVALFEADCHDGPAICSNFFKTLRPKRSVVDHRFLWRKLGWFYTQPALLALQQQTTGIINLKFAEYLDARLELPADVHEQAKIAQILDTLDTTIRQTEAIIEKLKQVKQGLLHDLLTRGVDPNGELRPPQSQAPHLYKDSPLGWIPSQWRVAPLVELASIRSGTTPARSAATRYFAGGETPWVKTLDLNEGVVTSTDERVTDAALRECSCERLPVGTVLIAMYGGWQQIGRTAMLGVPAATNQAISALVFGSCDFEPEYVLRAIQHGRPRWASLAASTRKDPNITKADVSAFRIPLPEGRDEQLRIVAMVRAALNRIEIEQAVLSKLQQQKFGLMDDLLTGRVRVTPLLATAPE